MKTLKDQLLEARLVTKKQVRKAEHEERQRRKDLGREGVEQEKVRLQREREERERRQRQEQRRQEQVRREEERAQAGVERLLGLVAGADLKKHGAGALPFYFHSSDGMLPRLEVSESMAERLAAGRAAIVELPGERFPEFYIVPTDVAGEVLAANPAAVRFWNRKGTG